MSAERVLSGPGLENLYKAIAAIDRVEAPLNIPVEITDAALAASCPIACAALHMFCAMLGNMSDRIFDEQVAKYAASWNSPSHPGPAEAAGPAVAVVAPAAPIATNPTPSPATVAPRYDFPSSRSIPPVNIMAPEPPEPRQPAAASDAQTPVPGAANGRPATTPLPPRRPAAPLSG
jgi:hypothetical protein